MYTRWSQWHYGWASILKENVKIYSVSNIQGCTLYNTAPLMFYVLCIFSIYLIQIYRYENVITFLQVFQGNWLTYCQCMKGIEANLIVDDIYIWIYYSERKSEFFLQEKDVVTNPEQLQIYRCTDIYFLTARVLYS
jgi:hypothetical protein